MRTLPILLVLAACSGAEQPPAQKPAGALEHYKERAQKGPTLSSTVQISPTESVSTLTIPSEFGPMLDHHCWIYRNQEFKVANMACPGAGSEDYSSKE